MDLQKLCGSTFECECGRTHTAPTHALVYARDAISQLPTYLDDCLKSALTSAAVVADERTWAAGGMKVLAALEKAGLEVHRVIVPDREGASPVCDDITCRWVKEQLASASRQVVIAVGSGVINDLCKWSSFELDIPYIAAATAASMNGYAAANVAAAVEGVKVVLRARPPLAVIAEPEIIENAPFGMTGAGLGDAIAKSQSTADWIMNNFLFGEYYCRFCAGMINELEGLYIERPERVREREPEAIKALFEVLFYEGVAMTLVGTSVPASGGEHLLSHVLDMMSLDRGTAHDLHGRQVGLGTILSAALYERVLGMERPTFGDMPVEIDRRFWKSTALAGAVEKQYAAKRQLARGMGEKLAQKGRWEALREKLGGAVRRPGQVKDILSRAGAACVIDDIVCPAEDVRSAAMHMHEIRSRVTIVDLAWLTGILPGSLDEIVDEWLR